MAGRPLWRVDFFSARRAKSNSRPLGGADGVYVAFAAGRVDATSCAAQHASLFPALLSWALRIVNVGAI